MRTKCTKRLLPIITLIMIMSFSLRSYAASCLDVIYYGDHRYAQRVVSETIEWQESFVVNGIRYVEGSKRVVRECVCGIQKVFYVDFFYEVPNN